MLNHMPNLTFHGDTEEGNEVHYENWPKHRNIEYFEERADYGDGRRFGYCIPKFKFW